MTNKTLVTNISCWGMLLLNKNVTSAFILMYYVCMKLNLFKLEVNNCNKQ